MCPNLESYTTIKRSSSQDNRLVSSNGRAGGIGGKKKQHHQEEPEQRAKSPRRVGIFQRQHSPRSVHKCAMETAKISDSSVSACGWPVISHLAAVYLVVIVGCLLARVCVHVLWQ